MCRIFGQCPPALPDISADGSGRQRGGDQLAVIANVENLEGLAAIHQDQNHLFIRDLERYWMWQPNPPVHGFRSPPRRRNKTWRSPAALVRTVAVVPSTSNTDPCVISPVFESMVTGPSQSLATPVRDRLLREMLRPSEMGFS